jgi:hypothetical protein
MRNNYYRLKFRLVVAPTQSRFCFFIWETDLSRQTNHHLPRATPLARLGERISLNQAMVVVLVL